MKWYYAIKGQQVGPVDPAQFEQLVAQGTIMADTLVWREGMAAWQPYFTVVVQPAADAPRADDDGTEVCAISGKRCPRREMTHYKGQWISAEHRDAFFQKQRESIRLDPADSAAGQAKKSGGLLAGLRGLFGGRPKG
jgi:hypothetical protein